MIVIWIMFLIIFGFPSKNELISFKCGVDSDPTFSKFLYVNPIENAISHLGNRRLDSEGFKNFRIHLDTYNLEEEMKEYNLTHYRSLFIDSMNKVIETLESLLRVKETGCYYFTDEDIKHIGINFWDKTKIGNEAINKSLSSCIIDIDLFIFSRFSKDNELSNTSLAIGGPRYLAPETGRPLIGIVIINRIVDYSKINSKYFQSIIIHEFTHILGFLGYFFKDIYHNVFTKINQFNITKAFINSTKVIRVARKYFNFPDVEGIELAKYSGNRSASSHLGKKNIIRRLYE